jgi:hypothetical protein
MAAAALRVFGDRLFRIWCRSSWRALAISLCTSPAARRSPRSAARWRVVGGAILFARRFSAVVMSAMAAATL